MSLRLKFNQRFEKKEESATKRKCSAYEYRVTQRDDNFIRGNKF